MTSSMDFTVINNLRAAPSRGRHVHVIQETVAISNGLQNRQLDRLDMPAHSYVGCAQCAKALNTASTMQQMNPALALGYLCYAYSHLEEGPCHVYDQALQPVDMHDPVYDTIQTAIKEAIRQVKKRRDFIFGIPAGHSPSITHEEHGMVSLFGAILSPHPVLVNTP